MPTFRERTFSLSNAPTFGDIHSAHIWAFQCVHIWTDYIFMPTYANTYNLNERTFSFVNGLGSKEPNPSNLTYFKYQYSNTAQLHAR